jgi:predicted MPP superfamily phosphohydrolase
MFWFNLGLLIVAIIGHIAIVRLCIALAHTHLPVLGPWQRPSAGAATAVLLVAIGIAVPIVMMKEVGTGGAKVLRGRPWDRVPIAWRAYIGVCVAAAGVEAGFVLGRRWRGVPAIQASNHRHVEDVAARCEGSLCGGGINGLLGRLPGNEVFELEIIRRELRLPGVHADLDGLTIAHLSDTHFNGTPALAYFERVCEVVRAMRPDVIVHTGDVADHPRVMPWLGPTLGRLSAPLGCYFVLGNHDFDTGAEPLRRAMTGLGWIDVAGRALTVKRENASVLIAGTERPWSPALPDTAAAPPADLRVLLTHGPQLYGWAKRAGFDLVLAGHLHGGQICVPYFGSLRPGRYLGGLFHEGRTVMHVSRGQGVMSPLRYGCRPEVTMLVLRAG